MHRRKISLSLAAFMAIALGQPVLAGWSCPTDFDGNLETNVDDLVAVITGWACGTPGGAIPPCIDSNGDGITDVNDLVEVVQAWGPCPRMDDDYCEFATELTLGVEVDLDMTSATVDADAPTTGCIGVDAPTAPGRWARVVGNGSRYEYMVCGDPIFTFDTRTTLFCGPCDALVCAEELVNNAQCDPFTEQGEFCSAPGVAYYLLIHGDGAATGMATVRVASLYKPCADPPCIEEIRLLPPELESLRACLGDIDEDLAAANNTVPETCRSDGDDRLNDGCLMPVPSFGVIFTGQTLPYRVCGTTSTYTNSGGDFVRDEDWHLYTPTASGSFTWDVIGAFNTYSAIAQLSTTAPDQPDCITVTLLGSSFGPGSCLTNPVTVSLNAGTTYALIASVQTAAQGGQDLPCLDPSGGAYEGVLSN